MTTRKQPACRKHVPRRTCVGCHQVLDKRALIRLVRTAEGVKIDPSGKASGRGAYLHDRRRCWELGLAGGLAHALKTTVSVADRDALTEFAQKFPEESPEE